MRWHWSEKYEAVRRNKYEKTLLFGEPMALLLADTPGALEGVEHFTRRMSGAEVNVAIGLTRLGFPVEYLTRQG